MDTKDDKPLKAQRWALWWAVGFYLVFLLIYVLNFDIPFVAVRSQADKWGQFGDYVGGVINPIVGLITIWLLTASLKQSQKEMALTRKALEDAEASQKATENALRDQLQVSEHARDMNNAVALYESMNRAYVNIQERIIDAKKKGAVALALRLEEEETETLRQLSDLGKILTQEHERIKSKYIKDGDSTKRN